MNGRTKSIAQRPTCLRCRETDKRQARTRGLCPSCYATTSRRVRRGQKTWDELEAANLVAKKLAFPLDAKKPAGRWLNHQVFESHEHGACRIQTAAAERSGLPRTCLRRWASGPCRHNDDEPILTLLVRHPIRMADQFVPVFPDNVIGPVAESYRKSKAKAEPDPDDDAKPPSNDDDALLSTAELTRLLGVGKHFVNYWQERESRLRPGEKALRTHRESSADKPGRTRDEQRVHRLGDARAIFAGKESAHPLVGWSATRPPVAKTDHEAKTIIHEHLLKMGGTTTRTCLFDLAVLTS